MRLARLFLKILGGTCTLIVLIGGAIFIRWNKPYLEKKVVRSSGPERILVEYVAYACGDTYPRLTEVFLHTGGGRTLAEDPFFISLPLGMPNPEESVAASNGNQFVLYAFRNEVITRNRITGEKKRQPSKRLDVFGWEIVTPYDAWVKKRGETISVTRSNPTKYFSQPASLGLEPFYPAKQDDCP